LTTEYGTAGPSGPDPGARHRSAWWDDLGVTLVWFGVMAVIAAVVWWQVSPLPEFTRTRENGVMGEEELGKQVAADAWYGLVAAAFGFVSGVVLLWWRRRDPVLMVALVAIGGIVATALMLWLGFLLGPDAPGTTLPGVPVGGSVPTQLEVHAHGLYAVWSVAALVGALGVVWGSEAQREDEDWAPPTASLSYGPDGGPDSLRA
jgi:hypothetical protein